MNSNVKPINKFSKNKPNVVVIGGGTGLSVLLQGLKHYTPNITAIVTVADNGGGSGVLREDLGMLPPGDIRSCLLALANTEPQMEKLLKYRFKGGSLDNQSFGNLFIAAMNGIYGSFEEAIRQTSNVLAITGKVLPMTLGEVDLLAELQDGTVIKGECEIAKDKKIGSKKIKRIFTDPKITEPLDEGLKAISDADFIIFGPGSLYTSVIPNLLVNNIVDNIKNSKAKKIFISNIMTQPGETDDYLVIDHINSFVNHSYPDLLDYVIVNNGEIPVNILKKYEEDESYPLYLIEGEREEIEKLGIEIIEDNYTYIDKNYIKHNNISLSETIISLYEKENL